MTDLDPVTMPPLSRIPRVELLHAGTWLLGTGESTFDADDLAAAVAALECPGVRRPVLKLGHYDPRFNGEDGAPYDGQPAVGYIDNLATTMNGQGLVGDYVGMPGWLGGVMASAYPDRSIEAQWNFTCQIGHVHPFVLTAVALLGVSAPGVGTLQSLQDVASLYGVAAAAQSSKVATSFAVTVPVAGSRKDSTMPNPTPLQVAAGVSVDDVRSQYYSNAPYENWITEMELNPLQLIVCDGSDRTWRVPVTIAGEAVTFGSPTEVVVQYIDKTATPVAAGAQKLVYASRAESRPVAKASEPPAEPPVDAAPVEPAPVEPATDPAPVDEPPTQTPAAEPVQPPTEEDKLSTITSDVRSRLGLAEDAPDEDVIAALDATITKANQPVPEPVAAGAPKLPDGVVAIDKATLEELKASAADGRQARQLQIAQERERLVDGAIQAGKVTPARRDHWLKQYDADSEGTVQVLASLEPVFPVGAPVGYSTQAEPELDDDKAFAGMFPPETTEV